MKSRKRKLDKAKLHFNEKVGEIQRERSTIHIGEFYQKKKFY